MRISDWSSDVCSSDLPRQRDTAAECSGAGLRPRVSGEVLKANVGRIADHCRVAGVGWGVEEVPYGHLCDAADCSNPAYSASGAPLVQFDTEDSGRRRAACLKRSEERRVEKEWVSTCRSRWSPYH